MTSTWRSPLVASREAENALADELADRCIAALEGLPAEILYSLADACLIASGPVQEFRLAIFYLATDREDGDPPGFLARSMMAGALQTIARQPDFLEELVGASTKFWSEVRDAAVAVAAIAPDLYFPGSVRGVRQPLRSVPEASPPGVP